MFDPDNLDPHVATPPRAKLWFSLTVSFDRAWSFMRSIIRLITLYLCVALGLSALDVRADDVEIHFRDTSGYVTDDVADVNDTYCTDADTSPVSRGSPAFTFDWDNISGDGGRDRDSGVDKALAGCNLGSNATGPAVFNLTLLSTGTKTVCIAAGDMSSDHWQLQQVKVYDNTTLLFTAVLDGSGGSGGTPAGSFMDASGVNRTAAAWRADQVCEEVEFATTTFKMEVGGNTDTGDTAIASLSITDSAPPTTTTTTTSTTSVSTSTVTTTSTTTTTVPAGAILDHEICGDGIDNDSSGGDTACSDVDLDRDGYTSTGVGNDVGLTGADCDDTNRYIYPGVATTIGAAALNYHTCQSNGTYTADALLSAYTCKSGSGVDYWIDDSVSTCHASNSYTNLSDWRCFSNTGMANYHAPAAGDCFIFKSAGEYDTEWSDHHIYTDGKNCTATDRCRITVLPGQRWWELGKGSGVHLKGTADANGALVKIQDSDYWDVDNLEVSTSGTAVTTIGLWGNGSDNLTFSNNYVHDIRGTGGDNLSGIRHNSGSVSNIHHNLLHDNYDVSNIANSDVQDILIMDTLNFDVHHNVAYSDDGEEAGRGVRLKHGGSGSGASYVRYNVIFNKLLDGIGVGGYPSLTVANNYLDTVNTQNSGFGLAIAPSDGGTVDYNNQVFEYNTIYRAPFAEVKPDDNVASVGANFATFRYNVVIDNRGTAYPADGVDGFVRISHYGSDALYGELITGGTLDIYENCYFNSAGTALYFDVFGDNSATSLGNTYATFLLWAAAGIDTTSVNTDPLLDADGRTTAPACAGWGWKEIPGGGSTTTTTSTTTVATTTTTMATTTVPVSTGSTAAGRGGFIKKWREGK